ncbi:MAG: RidA family protein [Alphaproteobacteria bacterium]|nr:RidA family protein [Alphaproteobacteria bacterium]
MNRAFDPSGIAPPTGAYSHGVAAPPGSRLLHVAGQIGAGPDGTVPPGFAEQAERVFENIAAILAGAGMTMADVVRVNGHLVRAGDIPAFRDVRDRHVGTAPPASTVVVVGALASPALLVEIAVVAARAP